MPKFPVDAPKAKVLKAFESLGFVMVREGNHLALERENEDGTDYAESSSAQRADFARHFDADQCSRDEFLAAYDQV